MFRLRNALFKENAFSVYGFRVIFLFQFFVDFVGHSAMYWNRGEILSADVGNVLSKREGRKKEGLGDYSL